MEEDHDSFSYQYIPYRGISPDTFRFFGIEAKINSEGVPVAFGFPMPSGATKVRDLTKPKKLSFRTEGTDEQRKQPCLVGRDKFSAGSAKSITIVEGDFDLPATWELLGSKYPVVSVRSSATARADCQADWDYLNSFGRIYLCLDGDEAGTKAKSEIAGLFDFNKVYDVKLQEGMDPDDYNQAGRADEFRRIWYNAKRFLPEGIYSSFTDFDSIIDGKHTAPIASYPFQSLEDVSYGIREGEVILLTALEGVGKTEYLRAIEYHILKTTDLNIGIIHLEESKDRSLKGLAGYELEIPCHIPVFGVNDEDIKLAYRRLFGRDDRVHLYSHFDTDDPDTILDRIRFLVSVCNCKVIFLDHITFLATSLQDGDTVKFLDYISTKLEKMVEDLSFSLIMISHENDNGDTRGSKNISKTATFRVRLERDLTATNSNDRNTTKVTILKNRYGAQTGPAGSLYFDPSTFIIRELTKADEEVPPPQRENA
jgi:twinkle protein